MEEYSVNSPYSLDIERTWRGKHMEICKSIRGAKKKAKYYDESGKLQYKFCSRCEMFFPVNMCGIMCGCCGNQLRWNAHHVSK